MVQEEALYRAWHRCRICGEKQGAKVCHIYSQPILESVRRQGSKSWYWKDWDFVTSLENAVVLCPLHHEMVDSKLGLQIYSCAYLQSLNRESPRCTALLSDRTRCPERGRPFRCPGHRYLAPIEVVLADRRGEKAKLIPEPHCCVLL